MKRDREKTRVPLGQVRFMQTWSNNCRIKARFKRVVARQLRRFAQAAVERELIDHQDELREVYGDAICFK